MILLVLCPPAHDFQTLASERQWPTCPLHWWLPRLSPEWAEVLLSECPCREGKSGALGMDWMEEDNIWSRLEELRVESQGQPECPCSASLLSSKPYLLAAQPCLGHFPDYSLLVALCCPHDKAQAQAWQSLSSPPVWAGSSFRLRSWHYWGPSLSCFHLEGMERHRPLLPDR